MWRGTLGVNSQVEQRGVYAPTGDDVSAVTRGACLRDDLEVGDRKHGYSVEAG